MKKTSAKSNVQKTRATNKKKSAAKYSTRPALFNKFKNVKVIAFVLVFAVLGTYLILKSAAAVPPPPAGGYFSTLPVGSALPTEAECASRVHRSSWEPRPENAAQNKSVPSSVSLPDMPDYKSAANVNFKPRITGNFTGTTDEIIQWASCKWGFNDDIFRAQAVNESSWKQAAAGDLTSNTADCPSDAVYNGSSCYQSYGLLQNKWKYNKPAYPMYRTMTAFHMDYSLMKLRSCYEGYQWLGNGYAAGDLEGCLGNWYSGGWRDAGALGYIENWRNTYNNKPWRAWVDYGTNTTTPDTTPPSAPASLKASAQSTTQINLTWTASTDNVGVTGYEVYRNGTKVTTVATTSFNDTNLAASTSYSYYVIAKDANGNASPASAAASASTMSAPVTTTPDADTTAPTVTITSPADGSTVGRTAYVKATASDNKSVVRMEVYIDGSFKSSSTSGSISYSWSTKRKYGAHTVTVKAKDAAGNVGTKSVTFYR